MRAPLVQVAVLLVAAAGCASPPSPALSPAPPRPRAEPTSVVRATGGAFDPTDRDGDGVGDAYDLCPTLLEDQRGEHPLDGCPDELDPARLATRWGRSPNQAVTVAHDQIKSGEEIRFARSSAAIEPSSQPLVASIAQVLKDTPEIEIVEIAGHADDSGSEAANNRLTVQRASSVMLAMIARGVSRDRLRAAGYGAYCPASGARREASTEAGDRRVEFRILRRDGVDLEPRWGGCEAAAKHGMRPASLPARRSAAARVGVDAARAGVVEKATPQDVGECADATPKPCKALCESGETDACMIFAAAVRGGARVPAGDRPDAAAALGALTKACDHGRLDACTLAASAVREGNGAPKDPSKALDLDAKACVKGAPRACADLGRALHVAVGKARDEAGSIEAYRRACELGDGDGCEALGASYWSGSGVKEDRARAFDLFVTACEIGRSGCAALRDHVKEDHSAQQNRARSLVALHVACEQDGDTDACGAIAIMGEKPGEYSPAPLCSAGDFPACRAACSAAPAGYACLGFGAALLYGTGARRKLGDATVIFANACQVGNARGCEMTALLHESKASGARDLRVAVDKYDLACSRGEASGCINRARMQIEGLGTYRDEAAAAKTLEAACTQGFGIACAHLGLLVAKGLGAPADPARARSLAARACGAGFRPSCAPAAEAFPVSMAPQEGSSAVVVRP
jgi:hypothetical protein